MNGWLENDVDSTTIAMSFLNMLTTGSPQRFILKICFTTLARIATSMVKKIKNSNFSTKPGLLHFGSYIFNKLHATSHPAT